jgi:hypothetical protein
MHSDQKPTDTSDDFCGIGAQDNTNAKNNNPNENCDALLGLESGALRFEAVEYALGLDRLFPDAAPMHQPNANTLNHLQDPWSILQLIQPSRAHREALTCWLHVSFDFLSS